jgi:hypothetical protein
MFAIDVNEWKMANLLEEKRGLRLSQIGQQESDGTGDRERKKA